LVHQSQEILCYLLFLKDLVYPSDLVVQDHLWDQEDPDCLSVQ
jgi:hypothetical protein